MPKGGGDVDTSGQQALAQAQQEAVQLSREEQAFKRDVWGKRIDPYLDIVSQMLGITPSSGGAQVPGGWLTGMTGGGQTPIQVGTAGGQPIYYQNGQLVTQNQLQGAGGGAVGGEGLYYNPVTGQTYYTDQPQYGGSLIQSLPRDVQPISGLQPVGGVGGAGGGTVSTPWGGDPSQIQYGPGMGFSTTRPGGGYTHPAFGANLYGAATEAGLQSAAQAHRGLREQDVLGPVMKSFQAGQIDLSRTAGIQRGILDQTSRLIDSYTGTALAGYTGAQPAAYMGQAISAAGQMSQAEQMSQAYAAQGNASMAQGLGSIAGLGLYSALGSGGALTGLFGAGAGSAAGAGLTAGMAAIPATVAAPSFEAGMMALLGAGVSDSRAKENIKPFSQNILGFEPVTFDYKPEYGMPGQLGFVADEIEKVAPGAVVRGPDGLRRINLMAMQAVLVQAIKELQQEVHELKGRIRP